MKSPTANHPSLTTSARAGASPLKALADSTKGSRFSLVVVVVVGVVRSDGDGGE